MIFKVIDLYHLICYHKTEVIDVILRLQEAVNILDIGNRMQILISNEYVDMTKYRKYLDSLPKMTQRDEKAQRSIEGLQG
jgi:hypothetical protein